MPLLERDARQGHERLSPDLPEPGVAGDDLGAVPGPPDYELPRRVVHAAQEVDLVGAAGDRCVERLADRAGRVHRGDRSRENDAFALADRRFKIAGGQQILVPFITAPQLLGVLEAVPPVGRGNELRPILVDLEVKPRKRPVETAPHASRNGPRAAVGLHVGVGEGVFVAEGEERAQPERGFRVSIQKGIADHQLRPLVDPQQLFAQDHPAHTVGDRRGGRVFKVGDVLMTPGLVNPFEPMQREVERLVVLHDGLVERRKQHIGAVAVVDGRDHQAVVLARIAAHDGRGHVAAPTVGGEHLALERVFQVAQFAFVESKY